jgi:hypothetical protein
VEVEVEAEVPRVTSLLVATAVAMAVADTVMMAAMAVGTAAMVVLHLIISSMEDMVEVLDTLLTAPQGTEDHRDQTMATPDMDMVKRLVIPQPLPRVVTTSPTPPILTDSPNLGMARLPKRDKRVLTPLPQRVPSRAMVKLLPRQGVRRTVHMEGMVNPMEDMVNLVQEAMVPRVRPSDRVQAVQGPLELSLGPTVLITPTRDKDLDVGDHLAP